MGSGVQAGTGASSVLTGMAAATGMAAGRGPTPRAARRPVSAVWGPLEWTSEQPWKVWPPQGGEDRALPEGWGAKVEASMPEDLALVAPPGVWLRGTAGEMAAWRDEMSVGQVAHVANLVVDVGLKKRQMLPISREQAWGAYRLALSKFNQ